VVARAIVVVVAAVALTGSVRLKPDTTVASEAAPVASALRRTYWPDGALRTAATYKDGAYDGEYRSWYANGRPFELRHYVAGHEAGLQQAWSDTGVLYINYEARNGRHYGMENSTPCVSGDPERVAPRTPSRKTTVPYFEDRTFTPHWTPVEHRIGEFRLTTQTGKAVTNRDLAGRIHVASFIYTRCAAVCPLLVRQLLRVQEATRGMPDVTLVSYTVAPDTDSPAVLASFGRDRGVDATRWWLLTGDRRQIYSLARRSYFADADRADDFLHTEKVLLVDGAGHLRGVYNGTQPFEIDQLASDIARLRGEAALH
jgi:protein SCO1/2